MRLRFTTHPRPAFTTAGHARRISTRGNPSTILTPCHRHASARPRSHQHHQGGSHQVRQQAAGSPGRMQGRPITRQATGQQPSASAGAGAQIWKGGMHGENLCQHRAPASASIIGLHHQRGGYHDNLSRACAPDVPALRPYPQRVLAVFTALASIGQHGRYLAALPICTPEYTL